MTTSDVVLGHLMKEVRMALQNRMILVSIFGGGRGALHVDFNLSMELIDNDSLVSPAKNTLRPKSRSNCDSVLSCLSRRGLICGIGMYFKPSPSNVLADWGIIPPVVRS